jgi:hypothetical protein
LTVTKIAKNALKSSESYIFKTASMPSISKPYFKMRAGRSHPTSCELACFYRLGIEEFSRMKMDLSKFRFEKINASAEP